MPTWSPDSQHVLMFAERRNSGGASETDLLLLRIDDAGVTSESVARNVNLGSSVAWRPDGGAVAIQEGTRIRILAVPQFTELASTRVGRIDGNLPLMVPNAMGFEADGKSLWLAVEGDGNSKRPPYPETITLAVRLDATDFHELERLTLATPVPGQRASFGSSIPPAQGQTRLEQTPAGLRLTALVGSDKDYLPGSGLVAVDLRRTFVLAINLETRTKLLEWFELPTDNQAQTNRIPRLAQLSRNSDLLVTSLSTPSARPNTPLPLSPRNDRRFDIFDVASQKRVATFGTSGPLGDLWDVETSAGALSDDGRYYFKVVAKPSGQQQLADILVVDTKNGNVVQRLSSSPPARPLHLSVSPDGTRILVLSGEGAPAIVDRLELYQLAQ